VKRKSHLGKWGRFDPLKIILQRLTGNPNWKQRVRLPKGCLGKRNVRLQNVDGDFKREWNKVDGKTPNRLKRGKID